jgi:hypothetical protein
VISAKAKAINSECNNSFSVRMVQQEPGECPNVVSKSPIAMDPGFSASPRNGNNSGVAAGLRRCLFRPERRIDFEPGQFVMLDFAD